MNKKKHFHSLVALALAIMMIVPAVLGVASNAAAKKTPGTVTLTKISAPAYNKVKVEWKKTSNATHYKIYYRKAGTSKWSGVKTVSGTASSYTHTSSSSKPIVVGQKYEYTVKGYNSTSKVSGKYNTKGLTVQTLPATVKLKSAELWRDSNEAVTVKWDKAAGCNYYLVYRKTGSSGWKKIATVENYASSYVDENPVKGVKNIYTVRGYYSKTKVSGKYDTKGVSVMVPKKKNVPVEFIGFDFESKIVTLQDSPFSLKSAVSFEPSNATDKSLTWKSSDPKIASVDSDGVVTPLSGGRVRITAQSKGPQAFCYIYVNDPESIARDMVEYTNTIRIKNGLPPFKTHPNLTKGAMVRAKELEMKYSHIRPNGLNSGSAITEAGAANPSGENIAGGGSYSNVEEVVDAWMDSPGHRKEIISLRNTYLGVGVRVSADGRWYWVQEFTDGNPDDKTVLILDTQGGSPVGPLYYPTDAYLRASDIPVPVKPGYKFVGWGHEPNANPNYFFTGVQMFNTNNMTLYAQWVPA